MALRLAQLRLSCASKFDRNLVITTVRAHSLARSGNSVYASSSGALLPTRFKGGDAARGSGRENIPHSVPGLVLYRCWPECKKRSERACCTASKQRWHLGLARKSTDHPLGLADGPPPSVRLDLQHRLPSRHIGPISPPGIVLVPRETCLTRNCHSLATLHSSELPTVCPLQRSGIRDRTLPRGTCDAGYELT
jgi:hypothetical protein